MNRILITAIILTTTMISSSVWSATLYRYVDHEGVTVLNRTIPPEFVPLGYTILNERGEVLKVVPRALTDEEKAVLRAEEQRVADQKARDTELRRLYRVPEDVDQAMLAWINRLNVEISLKNSHLQAKKQELSDLQSTAADIERSGKSISDTLMAQIRAVQAEMADDKAEIEAIFTRIALDIKLFDLDKIRVSEMTGIEAKSTVLVLEEHQLAVPDFYTAPDSN